MSSYIVEIFCDTKDTKSDKNSHKIISEYTSKFKKQPTLTAITSCAGRGLDKNGSCTTSTAS